MWTPDYRFGPANILCQSREKAESYNKLHLFQQTQFSKKKDTSYVWEIDVGNKHFYIDGLRVIRDNPLRYVNGVLTKEQRKKVNVEPYQYDKKISYWANPYGDHIALLRMYKAYRIRKYDTIKKINCINSRICF